MERCETCRWWGIKIEFDPFYEPSGKIIDFIEGQSPYDDESFHICAMTVTHQDAWDGQAKFAPSTKAWCEDYDGGHEARGLWTAPDFGCVQWESK